MSSTTSKVVEDANDRLNSLGYHSLAEDTECINCPQLIAKLQFLQKEYNSSICATHLEIHIEIEDHRKQIATLENTHHELRDQMENLKSQLREAHLEVEGEANERKYDEETTEATSTNITFSNLPSSGKARQRAKRFESENRMQHRKHDFYKEVGINTATERMNSVADHYQNLLETIAKSLLSSDILELKVWANELSIGVIPDAAIDVFHRLDQKEIIDASNLSQLRDFFESILKYDLVHVIDEFQDGNYDILKEYVRIAGEVVEGANESLISLGYYSLVPDTECKNCEQFIAELQFQRERYNSSIREMHLQSRNERQHHRKQIKTLERTHNELRGQIEILTNQLHQARLELGGEASIRKCHEESAEATSSPSMTFPDLPSSGDSPQRAETLKSDNKPHSKYHFDKQGENDTATGRINSLRDHYQNLLQIMAKSLLSSDISKLKDWANQLTIGVIPDAAIDVLHCLDQKEIMDASNLNQLRDFFVSIRRYDLVYVIDEFQDGNYDVLNEYVR